MPLDSATKRKMRRHIALNEFHKDNPDGTIIDIRPVVCDCGKWVVGDRTCKCGKTTIHLDYSETTGEVIPTHLPVTDM